MAARLLALAQTSLIPYTLFVVNMLAAAGGTLALGLWLRRKRLTPWLALAFGVYPGTFVATTLDVNEPLAYALVAAGILAVDSPGSRNAVLAGVAFGLAGLAREISVLFPAIYGLSLMLSNDPSRQLGIGVAATWRKGLVVLALGLAPLALWEAFIRHWLGATAAGGYQLLRVPLSGLFSLQPWQPWHITEIWGIVIPGIVLLLMGLWALARRRWRAQVFCLLANLALCLFMLSDASWDAFYAPSRIGLGVAIATVTCIPVFDEMLHASRRASATSIWLARLAWFGPCAALWLWMSWQWESTMERVFLH
jgi:hypothetical protein